LRYRFKKWEDGSVNPTRTVNLKANMVIEATYEVVSEVSYKPSASPSGTAKVRRKTALTLDPLSVDVDEGATVTFTGRLSSASGPTAGTGIFFKTIHLYVDGQDTGVSATTDSDGNYTLDYTWTTLGEYTYETRYLGD